MDPTFTKHYQSNQYTSCKLKSSFHFNTDIVFEQEDHQNVKVVKRIQEVVEVQWYNPYIDVSIS